MVSINLRELRGAECRGKTSASVGWFGECGKAWKCWKFSIAAAVGNFQHFQGFPCSEKHSTLIPAARSESEVSMIIANLKPCPFCGNPAEIVPCKAPEWHSKANHVCIRCSSEFCMMHDHGIILLTACVEDYCNTLPFAVAEWNTRKRRNKLYYGL